MGNIPSSLKHITRETFNWKYLTCSARRGILGVSTTSTLFQNLTTVQTKADKFFLPSSQQPEARKPLIFLEAKKANTGQHD